MFDQVSGSGRGGWGLPALALTLIALGVAGWWAWREPPVARVEPVAAPPVARPPQTAAAVRESVAAVLSANPGGQLLHVSCDPLPCLVALRLPLAKEDGAWRHRTETALVAQGWVLSPAGKVAELGARQLENGVQPPRAVYALALRTEEQPMAPEARAEVKERLGVLLAEAKLAVGPW
jgi:hypothetical protein